MRFEPLDERDAGSPDATAGTPRTFGERPTSQVTGVTTDTFIAAMVATMTHGSLEDLSIVGSSPDQIRALVRFDLSTLAPSATILGAVLRFELVDYGDQFDGSLAVHRVTEGWDEQQASWVSRGPQAWSTPGMPLGERVNEIIPVATTAIDLPSELVQGWVSDPASNAGVAILAADESQETHYHFASREHTTPAMRPELVVYVRE